MFKRIINFKMSDWKHIWWLWKNMHIQFFKGNFSESYEAWMWILVHLSYDSEKKEVE
ncbi:hypothetical protein IGI58_003615 [Enterococcus sp. AZ020]